MRLFLFPQSLLQIGMFMDNVLSVDVEDWFHILELDSTPDIGKWAKLESRVERNFYALIDEFDEANVKATFFFLGWMAERHPNMVKDAQRRGHEVASHGYAHQLVYSLSRREFAEDIRRAKGILEDLSGTSVNGYRCPGFSIIESTSWAFDELVRAGYQYDSSIFPASRGHGGIRDASVRPYTIRTSEGEIVEFPVTVVTIARWRLCFFGGGYLRLFPYFMIRHMTRVVNEEGRPVIYYVHPREIDPDHPRLPMSWPRHFKSYVNLHTTFPKLKRLVREERLVPFRDWLKSRGSPPLSV